MQILMSLVFLTAARPSAAPSIPANFEHAAYTINNELTTVRSRLMRILQSSLIESLTSLSPILHNYNNSADEWLLQTIVIMASLCDETRIHLDEVPFKREAKKWLKMGNL